LAIPHPRHLHYRTSVELPEEWTIHDEETSFDEPAFRGRVAISGEGNQLQMEYLWASQIDHLPAGEVASHVAALGRYREKLGYTLSHTPAASPGSFRLNWTLVFLTLLSLIAWGYLARRVYLLPPRWTVPPIPNP